MIQFLRTKIGFALVVAFIIIFGAFIFKIQSTENKKIDALNSKITLVANESVKKAIENGQIDTKSWEETLKNLVGTSTLDEKATIFTQNSASSTYSDQPLTATDRFAQAFFTRYVELKKSGAPIDETTGLGIVNELLTQDYGGPAGETVYSLEDITLLDTSLASELKKYGNNLGIVFSKPTPAGYENELFIVNRVNETGKKADLKKLAQNISRYTTIRKELLETGVPKTLKNAHLAIINSLSFIIEGIKGMSLMETDPVGATKMILKYDEGLKALDLSTHQLTSYFKQQNIKFSSSEPGYIFTE